MSYYLVYYLHFRFRIQGQCGKPSTCSVLLGDLLPF
uniref:Uncharacterized protein n=1 Tax=Anguilla anguilla TaxID=7936 RepID=A0A0E9T6S2_ANGAN